MTLLFRVLYAAHAKGTHHKLALDALNHLGGPDAELWRRVFLKHAETYLQGAKAPDDEFKDFKNHVLHVRDDFWGGAPIKARAWYTHLVDALERHEWSTAAYCAGVLSHYVTDPVQPFHTAQSEAENNIHRAAEWSISKAYDDLKRLAERELTAPTVLMPEGSNWLELLVCETATEANRHYEKLIAHYDIHRGVVDPPTGLDVVSRRVVAGLIALACRSFAAVLQRAIEDAKAVPPEVSLSLSTVLATLRVPIKVVARRLADGEERRLVQAMYDELRTTGTVEKNLPEDERTVRDLHAAEVTALRPRSDAAARFAFAGTPAPMTTVERARRARVLASARSVTSVPVVAPAEERPPSPTASVPEIPLRRDETVGPDATPGEVDRIYLAVDQDVVEAPSIGPKTAARLNAVGIDTVDDLLKAHPIALAARLDDRHFTEETIVEWQDQARLVCSVPGLRGTGAQLLTGAGYRTAELIAEADADQLCADVLAFAGGSEGQRVLRDGNPPDIAKIKAWVESARRAKAA